MGVVTSRAAVTPGLPPPDEQLGSLLTGACLINRATAHASASS